MITAKNLVLSVALTTVAPLAMAVQPDGLYVGEELGRSIFSKACSGLSSSTYTKCKGFDFGQRTDVGYKFSEQNAAEISYYSSGQYTKKGTGGYSDAIDSVEWQFSGIRYAVVNIGQDTGRFLVFGRYGLVHWEASEAGASRRINASGNSILLGVGAKYYITQDTAVRLQYDLHKVGNSTISWKGDVNFFSLGLTYQF